MAILDIELMGSPVLRERAAPVGSVGAAERRLVDDMFQTMHQAQGIGLAAPQVGVSKRILVVDFRLKDGTRHRHALVNPVIVEASAAMAKETEGCLSIPGLEEVVARPVTAAVEASSIDGDPVRIEADGILARVLQHEVDHLDGVLFVDRLSPLKRSILLRKWRKRSAS